MDKFSHISDEEIKSLYKNIHDLPYSVIEDGKRLAATASDKLAVLAAMKESLRVIIEDMGEHGDANKDEYGNQDMKYFKDEASEVDEQISKLKEEGGKSDVFAEWKRKYDLNMAKSVDDFDAEMDKITGM